jgi:hypothetical protein
MANRALGEQLDEARAEVERLKALCNDPEPIEVRVLAAQMDGDQRVVAMMRERDEARAQIEALQSSAQMACETPPPSCDCAGCSFAREVANG